MTNILHITQQVDTPGADAPITVRLYTPDVINRNGWAIAGGVLDMAAYRQNPVVLWAHNHNQPIGISANFRQVDGSYLADLQFDPQDTLAQSVEAKLRGGYLRAVSIGIDVKEAKTLPKSEWPEKDPLFPPFKITAGQLTEVSVVAVPADTGALRQFVQALAAQDAPDFDPYELALQGGY